MKRTVVAILGLLLVAGLLLFAPLASHHLLPLSWTGEARRLADVIEAREGSRIAEIGAGGGAMAREIATIVGRQGVVFATEISADLRGGLEEMSRSRNLPQIVVVEAQERSTNLQTGCCSAIYMRNVLHHIDDWRAYADDLRRTVHPGGIVAIIDFAPGAMFLLPRDHGAPPDRVIETFTAAGFRMERRIDDWGGRTYLLAFRSSPADSASRSPAVLSSARYVQSPPVVGRLCGRRGGVHCQCAAGDSDASLRLRLRAVRRLQARALRTDLGLLPEAGCRERSHAALRDREDG